MKVLIFDNYDSFTYNLAHLVRSFGYAVDVFRNDRIAMEKVAAYDKIILSPGPGTPVEAGELLTLVKQYAPTKSILGVCLGHQAIAECFGATLLNLDTVYHGVASEMNIIASDYIFDGVPATFQAGRYHSWAVSVTPFPDELQVTALSSEDAEIMAIKHSRYDVHGVQFHPESVLTPEGATIVHNFLKNK
ncbi:MAG: aminodeoxychorismate/anthranilate synthase component II [Dysgonamonadaceae bacterium]|jgi:anthranilate synthase component 2|nr:aminodeoxychorismate/anthranilate synthase component II [Dysgonamonadaceae bacterium]